MPITRVNEFQAKPGQERPLREVLASVVPVIPAVAGCRSCVLLAGLDDPCRIIILEEWDSIEAHKGAAKAIPPAEIQRVMPLLAGPPRAQNFE